MPLRSFRFYLFGYLRYYGHIRLPRLHISCFVRVSHVHVLPSAYTQHHPTPDSPPRAYLPFLPLQELQVSPSLAG